jgi:murein DD-endopeptidase MepM/ murein hydrolase activator NlpD
MGVLVVIEHDNGWRSLTVGLDYSAVRPGETVTQGSAIGVASRDHRVRFELRDADAQIADSLSELRG